MTSSVSYIIVFVLLAVGSAKASTCSSEEEIIHFSVSSKKNSSNHRNLLVDLQSRNAVKSSDGGEITLDVEHGRSKCNNGELVRLSTSISVLEAPLHRDDYELFPGIGYYKLHTKAEVWETAREICESEDAHLIVINSDVEANVVKEFFSRKPTFTDSVSPNHAFVGFHDKYTDGDYVTVTGVSLSKSGYAKWDGGEPNGGAGSKYGGVSQYGLFHDVPSEWKMGFICEQEL